MSLKQQAARKVKSAIASSSRTHDSLLLQGSIASMMVRSMQSISSVQDVEFRVFSQFGQDGIIDWVVEKLNLPYSLQTFVEFGVESYEEANTRFLMENRNWRGLILDGNPTLLEDLKRSPTFWKYDLTAKTAFINRDNINDLISNAGFSGDIGLLSIDIDGNDYWVWQAITVIRPVICICEFNAVFGNLHAISVPYDANFIRNQAHSSNLYFGASINAFRSLSKVKGYTFIGTTRAGNDAFFVRDDYAPRVTSSLQTFAASASRTRESRDEAGRLSYVAGKHRLPLISSLPVLNIDTEQTLLLKDLEPISTEDWQ